MKPRLLNDEHSLCRQLLNLNDEQYKNIIIRRQLPHIIKTAMKPKLLNDEQGLCRNCSTMSSIK
jgi:hypothetical protein